MLTGEKVTLRAAEPDDVDAMYEIAAELETWEERNPSPARPVTRVEYGERFTKVITEAGENIFFIIEVDRAFVGQCNLFEIDHLTRSGEVGIALHSSARGHGYGTEALRLLVRFAFERHNLRRIHLRALASNAAGLACYRHVGFVEEGRRRESAWVRGHYEDEVEMGLLRDEWST